MTSESPLSQRLRALRGAPAILCSACLLGHRCRYDGKDKRHAPTLSFLDGREVIPICPEALGALPCPRPPADLSGGDGDGVLCGAARVVDREGRDVTRAFLDGAQAALTLARQEGARAAILKEGSPSCGLRRVQCDGVRISGRGVAAALLASEGFLLASEEEIEATWGARVPAQRALPPPGEGDPPPAG